MVLKPFHSQLSVLKAQSKGDVEAAGLLLLPLSKAISYQISRENESISPLTASISKS